MLQVCPTSDLPPILDEMLRIHYWQWLNLLAFDATCIALAWQEVFANSQSMELSLTARLVLGLSVWLTYMADRLFDVARRPISQLHSARHRFSKQHSKVLWSVWGSILLSNMYIAFNHLSTTQLRHGGILLVFCLLYTTLNQKLSRFWFPKELCVAMIYAGGVVVFLPNKHLWFAAGSLTLLCLVNCLAISTKEQCIDRAMQVRSLTHRLAPPLAALAATILLSSYWLGSTLAAPILISLFGLLAIQHYQKKITVEAFRVLADCTLLVGPAITYFIHR